MSGPRDAAGDSEAGAVMARQSIGHVIERPWSDGRTVSYGAQRPRLRPLREGDVRDQQAGMEPDPGGARDRADRPADRAGYMGSASARAARGPPARSRWRRSGCRSMRASGCSRNAGGAPSSSVSTRTRSTTTSGGSATCERFFGRYRLSEITPQLVDRFRDELHEQAETIRRAQERARTDKARRALDGDGHRQAGSDLRAPATARCRTRRSTR